MDASTRSPKVISTLPPSTLLPSISPTTLPRWLSSSSSCSSLPVSLLLPLSPITSSLSPPSPDDSLHKSMSASPSTRPLSASPSSPSPEDWLHSSISASPPPLKSFSAPLLDCSSRAFVDFTVVPAVVCFIDASASLFKTSSSSSESVAPFPSFSRLL